MSEIDKMTGKRISGSSDDKSGVYSGSRSTKKSISTQKRGSKDEQFISQFRKKLDDYQKKGILTSRNCEKLRDSIAVRYKDGKISKEVSDILMEMVDSVQTGLSMDTASDSSSGSIERLFGNTKRLSDSIERLSGIKKGLSAVRRKLSCIGKNSGCGSKNLEGNSKNLAGCGKKGLSAVRRKLSGVLRSSNIEVGRESKSVKNRTKRGVKDRTWFHGGRTPKQWLIWTLKFIALLPFRIINLILRFFWSILNFLLLGSIIAVVIAFIIGIKVLPMYQEASKQAYDKLSSLSTSSFQRLENTKVYDKDGKLIGQIDAGDYHYADITEVSKYVQWGYIAIEDKRFTEHCGIDVQSLTRAGLALIRHNGEITQGGSTITQQVIKNCLLTQEQSYSRKLVEVLLAPKIEQRFSKDKIMEFYVNTNYYGNLCYGVDTASRYYFGKKCSELTLSEAAMLCGVSNSPNNYNPVKSMDLAIQRRDKVLEKMLELGYITQEEYLGAKEQKIKLKIEDNSGTSDNYMVSYAIHCLAIELMEKDGFKFQYVFEGAKAQKKYEKEYSQAYKSKSSLIRSGGYQIYTSFDIDIQKKLQKSIDDGLRQYKGKQSNGKYALQGASVCIDNETGYVIAMVGGRGKKDEFNRAFLSSRQPGSTIKPLLDYSPAINEGIYNPSSVLVDQPVYAIEGDETSYSPKNSGGGYRGKMKLREGLARSINTIAYQVYKKVGSERAISYLENMRFTSLSYADNSADSLALGGFTKGCKVVDMAKGYSTLAMGGHYTKRTCLKSVTFQGGDMVYQEDELGKTQTEVYTADTAYMITDMMQGTLEEGYGTGHSIKDDRMIIAGKTGTTSSNKDAWFCGYSKYYTTAVWVGYDTPKVMSGMYGGTVPASIFKNFMTGIKKNLSGDDFDRPETISLRKTSDGNYVGEDLKLKEGKRGYLLRTGSKEWFSELNRTKYDKYDKETRLQDAINKAKKAVDDFVSFSLTCVEDAVALDEKYSQCLKIIDDIGDEYKEISYKERAAEHYELLSGELKATWLKQIKEYNKAQSEEKRIDAKAVAEDNLHSAKEALKQTRINKAEWYLSKLDSRKYYTDVVEILIRDLREAVKRLKGYNEYSSYRSRMKSAISSAEGLPTPPIEPEVPQDSEDNHPIDESTYIDPEQD